MAGSHQRKSSGNVPRITSSRTTPASHASSHSGSHSRNIGNTSFTTYDPYDDPYARESRRQARGDNEAGRKHDNKVIRIIIGIIVSIVYWPLAIIGVASPFMSGFNFGALAAWQVIFSRFWLAFVMGGIIYALAINLFHIRDRAFFQRAKAAKIAAVVVLAIAISFGVIRVVCML